MKHDSHPLRSLFLDMDSYFASVEQYLQPHLRGKSVGVAPMLVESSCCIAASYEAKAFGVKTGTRVAEARQLCPGITIVEARPLTYVDFHHQIVEIVESCIHVDHVLSIDEMICWLPFNWRTDEKVQEIGALIKQRLADAFEGVIRCSIGVASNGWLAKMGSKMRKPDGFLLLKNEQLPEILYDLELKDLHGIGNNMELRLHANGVHSVEQLCASSQECLKGIWGGVGGVLLWRKLRGEEVSDIDSNPRKRSIGHGHVLPPAMRVPKKAITVIHRLLQKAAFRARSHGLKIGAVDLSLQFTDRTKWSEGIAFTATADTLFLTKVIKTLWSTRPHPERLILKANITFYKLVTEASFTPSLFEQEEIGGQRNQAAQKAMDQVIDKFGKKAAYFGGAHGAMETAQPKIAFQHIPNIKNEK